MIRLPIDELRVGMALARPIYDEDGRVLLSRGVVLRQSFVDRLRDMGYLAVYIDDPRTEGVAVTPVVADEVRSRAVSQVRKIFAQAAEGGPIDTEAVFASVDRLIEEILANRGVIYSLNEIRSIDGYTFAHSVNVCILSVMTGLDLGLSPAELRELAVGAILHDIGKARVDGAVVLKEGRLERAEMEEMKRHTRYGFDMLRQYPEISLRSAHVAYQHHERVDGTGYPRSLKGEAIHPLAKIVMVADTFDAMTSDRIYRKAVPQHAAVTLVGRMAGRQFSAEIVEAFLRIVAPYPVGTRVALNTGEIGVVTNVARRRPDRPVVRLLSQADGRAVREVREIDLSEETGLKIVEVI